MAEDFSKKTVVHSIPEMDAIRVQRDGAIDIYRPANDTIAAVVIVAGYPDGGFERAVGCKFKDTGSSVSWARLIAASGITAVTYSAADPVIGLEGVLGHLQESGFSRLGLWASSGNAPLAVSRLMRDARKPIACAVLCYPYTLKVPAAAKKFGFVTPADERSVAEMSVEVPLLLVRAGRDEMPELNKTLDEFIAAVLQHNLPVTIVNHPSGPHAFDLVDDTRATRAVIQQMLAFIRARLLAR